jgi:hypothetical protein
MEASDGTGLRVQDARQNIRKMTLARSRYLGKVWAETQDFFWIISLWIEAFERDRQLLRLQRSAFLTSPLASRPSPCVAFGAIAHPNFLLHRLQHLPARIHAEKRRDATTQSIGFCLLEESGVLQAYNITTASVYREVQAAQPASLSPASRSHAKSCTKADNFSRFHSLFRFPHLRLNNPGRAQIISIDYLTAGTLTVLRDENTQTLNMS